MKRMIMESFSFPGGGLAQRTVASCMEKLTETGMGVPSRERIIDFCVCQVYAVNYFGADYLRRWKVNHSFGNKAIERFQANHSRKKHFEDKWLASKGVSRLGLLEEFRDKSVHPLTGFIYPEYEDRTKARLLNMEAGFRICQLSTLLFTPFSPICNSCRNANRCKDILERKHPELYRIRIEAHQNQKGKE